MSPNIKNQVRSLRSLGRIHAGRLQQSSKLAHLPHAFYNIWHFAQSCFILSSIILTS